MLIVSERFIELLSKKLNNELDEAGLNELKQLIAGNDAYKKQYKILESYWLENRQNPLNGELMFNKILSRIDTSAASAPIHKRIFTPARLYFTGIAAILISGVFLFLYYTKTGSVTPAANKLLVLKTESRQKSKITLSDGSVITLNSETKLSYPAEFSAKTREVYLTGEAFFDVATDKQHPFIVHAGKMNVKVLGTAFDIKSYSGDATSETTLLRGAIEVTLTDRPSDRIFLKPNDKLVLTTKTITKKPAYKYLRAVRPDSVETNYLLTNLTYLKANDTTIVETSWVNNKLVFKDEEFDMLANNLQRWYGVAIKFKSPKAKKYHFTGVFYQENIAQALDALALIEPFTYKLTNQTVYIY